MKISQIAIYVPDVNFFSNKVKEKFNIDFYKDNLKMDGEFLNGEFKNIPLELAFFHGLIQGCELEFINSESCDHWHQEIISNCDGVPFLSHLGVYCSSYSEFDDFLEKFKSFEVLQHSKSKDHSNKRPDGTERHYEDVIFNTRSILGFNIKFTVRI